MLSKPRLRSLWLWDYGGLEELEHLTQLHTLWLLPNMYSPIVSKLQALLTVGNLRTVDVRDFLQLTTLGALFQLRGLNTLIITFPQAISLHRARL